VGDGAALIEALRLFKDYGFRNTVKIIFFSGEEDGLCGSLVVLSQASSLLRRIVCADVGNQ
jgi:Zn-dependent M28 family amino/carboxypeptidase